MVNKRILAGMLVMVLTFGMAVIGCDPSITKNNNNTINSENNIGRDTYNVKDSKWKADGAKMTLTFKDDSTYVYELEGTELDSGKYTVSDTIISCDGGGDADPDDDEDLGTFTIITENRIKDARADNPTPYYDRIE